MVTLPVPRKPAHFLVGFTVGTSSVPILEQPLEAPSRIPSPEFDTLPLKTALKRINCVEFANRMIKKIINLHLKGDPRIHQEELRAMTLYTLVIESCTLLSKEYPERWGHLNSSEKVEELLWSSLSLDTLFTIGKSCQCKFLELLEILFFSLFHQAKQLGYSPDAVPFTLDGYRECYTFWQERSFLTRPKAPSIRKEGCQLR